MGLQSIFQLGFGGRLDHLGQGLDDLGFSRMELLQLVKVEFPKTIKICREEFHGDLTKVGLDLQLGFTN
jgi:hypothetical protein